MSLYNPSIAKCPACKAEMRRHAHGWRWIVASFVLWIVFLSTALPRLSPFTPLGFLIMIVLACTWVTARDRLYHSYWKWRHPLRCEEGGHAEPLPENAN